MYLADKNKHLQNLQCLQEEYGAKLYKSLSYGNCPEEKLILNEMLTYIIRVLRRYEVFTSEVTYAYSFTFERLIEDDSVTVSIDIDGTSWSYTGTGTAEEIVTYFYQQINDNTTTPEFKAERVGAILYIYSYATAVDFSATNTITISDEDILTVTDSTMEDDLDDILDIWNCVTSDQICEIINLKKKIKLNCNNC